MRSMDIRDRESNIADIIREYSKGDVNRDWLINKNNDMDNVFKRSFNTILDYTREFDLSLWYLAFSQSFGKNAEVMHRKMAELCTNSDKEIITFKKDVPAECPYLNSKNEMFEGIFNKVDFNKSNKEIISAIYNVYESEKYYHKNKWCNWEAFNNCEYKEICPISDWITIINQFKLPYIPKDPEKFFYYAPKIFFYYDTLCLLNNDKIANFDDLFLKVNSCTNDKTKKTIIVKTILEQIRGISTKSLLFLQMENIFNERDLDYSELIFKDSHAVRVAKRMSFPFYENDLVEAIRKFGESYNLTARQIDMALWEMGFVCTANECLHGVDGKKCIFYDVCSYEEEQ
jgi:hypothetical protein